MPVQAAATHVNQGTVRPGKAGSDGFSGLNSGAPGDQKHYPVPTSRHWCLIVPKIEMMGLDCPGLTAGLAMTVLGRESSSPDNLAQPQRESRSLGLMLALGESLSAEFAGSAAMFHFMLVLSQSE